MTLHDRMADAPARTWKAHRSGDPPPGPCGG